MTPCTLIGHNGLLVTCSIGFGSALDDASDGRSSTDDDVARLLPDVVELLLFWRRSLRSEVPLAILGIMVYLVCGRLPTGTRVASGAFERPEDTVCEDCPGLHIVVQARTLQILRTCTKIFRSHKTRSLLYSNRIHKKSIRTQDFADMQACC